MSSDPEDIQARVRAALTEDGEDAQRELGVVQGVASQYQPDQYAQSRTLGAQFGVPAKTVADNPEPYKKASVREAVRAALSDAPATQAWMGNLDNAAVAQDDVDTLAKLERSVGKVSGATRVADVARSVPGGFYRTFGMSTSGVGRLYGVGQRAFSGAVEGGLRALGADSAADFLTTPRESLVNLDPGRGLIAFGSQVERDADIIGVPAERQNLATDIGGGLGQIAGQIAVALTGGTIPSTLSLLGQGADIQGDRAEAAGASQQDTDKAVVIGALVTSVTEKYQLDRLLKAAPEGVRRTIMQRLTDVAMAGGSEALQEVVEGIGQNLTAKAIYEPDAAIFEGLERDALAAGGAGAIAKAIIDAIVPGRARQQGRRDGDAAAEISTILGESKLATRSPEALEQLAAAIRERTGAQFAYVDAAAFRTLYQSDDEANAAANELTGGQNAYTEASLAGTPIAIPLEKYIARIAPQAGELEVDAQPFTDFVSFDPDGMNGAEVEGSRETIERQAKEIADREMGEARPDASEAVYEDVVGQLLASGMERSTSEKNAKLMQSVFRTLGTRVGIDPKVLYDRYALRVRRELPDVLGAVPQVDLALDPLLDRLRAGDVPSQADAFGPSLLDFVRSLGGLKDEGGELAARDVDKANKPFQRNVLQPNGRSLDDVAEVLVEAGYLTVRDPNALLDLIDQELRGDPIFAFGNQKQDVIATREYLMQLEEELGRRGIDLKQTSNLEARRILSQRRFDQGAKAKRVKLDSLPRDIKEDLFNLHATGVNPEATERAFYRNSVTLRPIDITGIKIDKIPDNQVERYGDPRKLPPLVIADGRLIDGQHRIAAARKLGITTLEAIDVTGLVDTNASGFISELPTELNQSLDQAPTFFSALTRAAESAELGKASAAQWLGTLKNAAGVKPEELQWSGIEEWLKGQGKSVTKEQVVEYLRANEIEVKDVVRGALDNKAAEQLAIDIEAGIGGLPAVYSNYQAQLDDPQEPSAKQLSDFEYFDASLRAAVDLIRAGKLDAAESEIARARQVERLYDQEEGITDPLLSAMKDAGRTTYGSYQLPGGENYRELLLTLPEKDFPNRMTEQERVRYERLLDKASERELTPEEFAEAKALKARIKAEDAFYIARAPFTSNHWDEKNILAHVCFNERTDAEGKRVLLIEEIQSDWHQAGRKKGYRAEKEKRLAELVARRDELRRTNGYVVDADAERSEGAIELDEVIEQINALSLEDVGVPDAPFKTTWPELAFKRMIRYAAENGFDRIAWTPGKLQAERYDLSKQVDEVEISRTSYGSYEFSAYKDGEDETAARGEAEDADELSEQLGKEMAKKAADIEPGSSKTFRGVDLQIGGEGMLGFYDKILPATVNKLVKKFGAKVGKTTIQRGEDEQQQRFAAGPITVQSVDVTPQMREAALAGQPLFQRGANDAKRGAITFGADRQFTVSLFEKADLSTFLHESGHFYLEIMGDLAEDGSAPQQIRDDYQTLLKWLGVKGRAGIATEQHEQFARGFEAYLLEGKSPSAELATVFDRFRAWLVGVYRTIARLNVTLNDDVRRVMDRIVATDQQIKEAEQSQGYAPVFLNAEAAGMSPVEWDAYRGIVDRAHRESVNELTGRAMAELARERKAWWKEEHAKVLVEVATEVDALPAYRALDILKTGKLPDGSALPAKLSRADLTTRYGKEFAKRVPRSATSKEGISAEVMAQLLGFTDADTLVKAIVTARPRKELIKAETDARMRERYGDMLTDGTLVEEAITAVHTEARAKVLAAELKALKRKRGEVKPFVDAAVESRKQQQRDARDANYGNLLSKAEITALREQAGLQVALNPGVDADGYAKLADRAGKKAFDFASAGKFEDAAGQRRLEVLNRELHYAALEAQEKARAAAARKKVSEQRAARDANAASLPDREEMQALRLAATRAISAKKIRDIQPALYRRAEAQAARAAFEAAGNGDFEQAYSEKRRQIYNYELFRAAVTARETIQKNVEYMRRFDKKSVREKLAAAKGQYLQQIDALRARFDFTNRPAKEDLKRDKLAKWVEEQTAAGREVTIPQWVIDEARTTPYKELLAIELDGLTDAAKNIEHLARTKDRLLRNRKEADYKAAKLELETRARASLKGGKAPPVSQFEMSQVNKFGQWILDFGDSLVRTESFIEWLDGGQSGPWHDFFMEPANNAEYARESLRTQILEPMRKLADGIDRERRTELHQKIRIESLKQSFNRRVLISIALNMGNASNMERLLEGGFRDAKRGNRITKFTPASLEEIKRALNAKDWQFIQEAWNTAELLWPQMKAFQERMGGLVPEKIAATPIETPHGTFAGGYWPAVYDSLASSAGSKQADSADALGILMGASFTGASTSKSALKARSGVGGPLKLDFSAVMGRHLDQVITDLTHREFAIQAMRILEDADLRLTLQDAIGEVGWASMKSMVAATINQDGGFADIANRGSETLTQRLISNLAVAALGFRAITAIGNLVLAPIQAAARVNPAYTLKGIAQFMRHPVQARAFVDASSEMMRNRAQNMDNSFSALREKLEGRTSIIAKTQRAAMSIHQAADYLGTTGIWLGRYSQALAASAEHAEAVRLADKAIRTTQTAGAPKDLSAFERNPTYRWFKLFIGPMIIMNNRMREAARKKGAVHTWPEAFGTMLAVWLLPAILWDIVNGRGPDDDDDDDEVLTDEALPWALRKVLVYPFSTLPYVRDAVSLYERMASGQYAEAKMNPASDAVGLVIKVAQTVAQQASEEDSDDEDDAGKITKAALRAVGPLTGMPTGQLDITGSFIWDVYSGAYEPEGAADLRYLLMRRPKDD